MANKGGQVTAIALRKEALERYYANPSICKQCGKVIEVKDGHRIRDSLVKSFCNRQCKCLYFSLHPLPCTHLKNACRGKSRTKETKDKISKTKTGRKGKPLSEINKKKLLDGRKKAGTTSETRRKLSLNACSNRHRFNNFKHVPFIVYVRKDGSEVTLRGSYEVRFAKYLDEKGFKWEYGKVLPYVDKNGVQRYMLPDFYVTDINTYFDTKGYLSKECSEKIELVREQSGIIVQLVFLRELENLEKGVTVLN